MKKDIKESIRRRRSVRTYDGRRLKAEQWQELEAFLQELKNPFGVEVQFALLDAQEHGLSSPVIVGAEQYIAAKVRRGPQAELAYGYCFEALCLKAEQMGLGTVMLAGTLSRKAFERAMRLDEGEMMPMVTPIGYPAEKMSVRETLMRKGAKSDERLPFTQLFFQKTFEQPLEEEQAGPYWEALEMVRLAPSAANKQPWRVVVTEEAAHFYKKAGRMGTTEAAGDIQKIDLGIALCHFDLTMQQNGYWLRFTEQQPLLEAQPPLEYILSCEVDD